MSEELTFFKPEEPREYESPSARPWTIGVLPDGYVVVLDTPNLSPVFTDMDFYRNPEEIGLDNELQIDSGLWQVSVNFDDGYSWEGEYDYTISWDESTLKQIHTIK